MLSGKTAKIRIRATFRTTQSAFCFRLFELLRKFGNEKERKLAMCRKTERLSFGSEINICRIIFFFCLKRIQERVGWIITKTIPKSNAPFLLKEITMTQNNFQGRFLPMKFFRYDLRQRFSFSKKSKLVFEKNMTWIWNHSIKYVLFL